MQRQANIFLTFHTALFTRHTCTSHLHFALNTSSHLKSCEIFSPHLSSSHLIPSLLTCHLSKFFSAVFISSEHWSTFLISLNFASTHLSCSARRKALTVREKSFAQKNHWAQKVFAHRHLRHRCINIQKPFRNTLYYEACTKHFPLLLCTTKLAQNTSEDYFVLQSLHKALRKTTLYYKACTNYVPVPQSATKIAKSTSQYYFVLRSLRKALPGTTLYYEACTKHFPVPVCTTTVAHSTFPVLLCTTTVAQSTFPVLLCTTTLAQSTSQCYFVLKSLRKALPSTTVYYNACTKHVPALLCTTKLAQSTSQYYFVLQSLHKALPSTTLYYEACAKHSTVLLCTTQLAQSTSR